MLDEAEVGALRKRILDDGWDQGAVLPFRFDLYLAKQGAGLTEEADRMAAGKGNAGVVFEKKPAQMVVVSQRCDLVADPRIEPLVEAMPVLQQDKLPGLNSTRTFLVEGDQRFVVDGTRRLLFEKALLPTGRPESLLQDEAQRRSFGAWCARRYSRVAFADDFEMTVGKSLDEAIKKVGRGKPGFAAIHSWRVAQSRPDSAGPIQVEFVVPYLASHAEAADTPDLVAAIIEKSKDRLDYWTDKAHAYAAKQPIPATIRPHVITKAQALIDSDTSLTLLRALPAYNLEYFTFLGDHIAGVEPAEGALS